MTRRQSGDSPWLEAAVAWEVCASIHQEYAKGKDALYTTRHGDFVRAAQECRERYAEERQHMSDIFLNSAKMVEETGTTSCQAIFTRVGGHGWSNAAFVYRRTFSPPKQVGWWNGPNTPANREARIYALLLAHSMHLAGDI